MEAKRVSYKGDHFRSLLELKWALFFERLGIEYEYEKHRLEEDYLPDFYLPKTYLRHHDQQGVFVEIRPVNYPYQYIRCGRTDKVIDSEKPSILFKGTPSNLCYDGFTGQEEGKAAGFECWANHWDDCMVLYYCDLCKCSKIDFQESNYNQCIECDNAGENMNRDVLAMAKTLNFEVTWNNLQSKLTHSL